MNTTNTSKVFPALRLWWMSRMFVRQGTLSRAECCHAWGISVAQASADFTALKALSPDLITYDCNAREYRWTGVSPNIPTPAIVPMLVQLIASGE